MTAERAGWLALTLAAIALAGSVTTFILVALS